MLKTSTFKIIGVLGLTLAPLFAFAFTCPAAGGQPSNFSDFVCILLRFMNTAIPIIIAATLLAFIWGLAKFILAAGDVSKINDGKMLMIWGVIALFVMVSFLGIINLLYSDIIGGDSGAIIPLLPISAP